MKRLFFLLISALVLFGSCTHYQDIEVKSVKFAGFNLSSSKEAEVNFIVKIYNPTSSSLTITFAEGEILKDFQNFADFHLLESATVGPNTTEDVILKLGFTLNDPLSLMATGLNLRDWNADDYKVNAKITIASGNGFTKNLKFKELSVEKIIRAFQNNQ